MKMIKEFPNRMDAEIARGLLENSGIKAFVASDDEGGLNPALSITMGARLTYQL